MPQWKGQCLAAEKNEYFSLKQGWAVGARRREGCSRTPCFFPSFPAACARQDLGWGVLAGWFWDAAPCEGLPVRCYYYHPF